MMPTFPRFFETAAATLGERTLGSHTVCAVMTAAFLEFSKSRGNDLSTPILEIGFRGLKPGHRWCLCAPRWQEALEAGQALRVTMADGLCVCSVVNALRRPTGRYRR